MAAKKTAAGFEFLVDALKANKGAVYADLKAKADAKGVTIYPVMFGRAKAMLGLVKSKPRGQGKAAKVARAGRRGPGRPKGGGESKSGKVRELLRSGMSAAEIAKQVGCSVNLVYAVKAKGGQAAMRRGPGRPPMTVKRGPGRPPKAAAATGLDGVIAALKNGEQERARLMRAFEQIRGILESVG